MSEPTAPDEEETISAPPPTEPDEDTDDGDEID